jgi:hypothetical protein
MFGQIFSEINEQDPFGVSLDSEHDSSGIGSDPAQAVYKLTK